MLYPRLKLAKDLLCENGLIFISINDIEITNLIKSCDEIFGNENHVATFVWKNKYGPGAFTKGVASLHEYIVCYAKHYPENIAVSYTHLSTVYMMQFFGNIYCIMTWRFSLFHQFQIFSRIHVWVIMCFILPIS